MTTALVVGVGAVGTRLARQLVSGDEDVEVVLRDERRARVDAVIAALSHHAHADDCDLLAHDYYSPFVPPSMAAMPSSPMVSEPAYQSAIVQG